jgi:hypothetical protein
MTDPVPRHKQWALPGKTAPCRRRKRPASSCGRADPPRAMSGLTGPASAAVEARDLPVLPGLPADFPAGRDPGYNGMRGRRMVRSEVGRSHPKLVMGQSCLRPPGFHGRSGARCGRGREAPGRAAGAQCPGRADSSGIRRLGRPARARRRRPASRSSSPPPPEGCRARVGANSGRNVGRVTWGNRAGRKIPQDAREPNPDPP